MGIKFFEYNNDGLMDLFVSDMHSDMTPTQMKLQQGFKRGVEKAKSEAYCGIDWTEEFMQGSSNNIFGNAFFQNVGNGKFAEVSDEINAETFWPWGVSVGDLNADGYPDMFITSGMGYPFQYFINSVLLNEQGHRFFDSEFVVGVEPRPPGKLTVPYFTLDASGADKNHPLSKGFTGNVLVSGVASSRSSAIFDVNNDGALDIVVNELLDYPQVLISNLSQKKTIHYAKVKLIGTKSNRDGLGAVVKVVTGPQTQTQPNDGKSGYLSQSSMPLYFGLGEATAIDRIEVKWPSGRQQTVTAPEINKVIEITEP